MTCLFGHKWYEKERNESFVLSTKLRSGDERQSEGVLVVQECARCGLMKAEFVDAMGRHKIEPEFAEKLLKNAKEKHGDKKEKGT